MTRANTPPEDHRPRTGAADGSRIDRAAKQLAAYTLFLRWSSNFPKEELVRHPRDARVMLLSPMQSGRFTFALDDETVYLGVQSFEAAWLATLPIDQVHVSDRLYLSVNGVNCIDSKLPPLAIGIFVDDAGKRSAMSSARWLQPVHLQVAAGQVTAVGELLGSRAPVSATDIVGSRAQVAREHVAQQDMSRFL